MGDFDGKVVLVTGGSSGIGRVTALAFAHKNAFVIVSDINIEGGENTIKLIESEGGRALFIKTDVSQKSDVKALIKEIIEKFGRLDCAFNNAGIDNPPKILTKLREKTWDHVINVNLKGVWLCMKYEIPQMVKQGGGAIVNTSSTAGIDGQYGMSIYSASKHGVLGLTKSAAIEFASKNVRINAVCPGLIKTPILDPLFEYIPNFEERANEEHPIGRIGNPKEVANAVVWLCSQEASFITGHALTIDGGILAGRAVPDSDKQFLGL